MVIHNFDIEDEHSFYFIQVRFYARSIILNFRKNVFNFVKSFVSIATCFKLNMFERTSRTADCLHRPNEQNSLNKPSDNKIKDHFWSLVIFFEDSTVHGQTGGLSRTEWLVVSWSPRVTDSSVSETSKIPKSLFEKQFRIVPILSQNQNVFKWFLTVTISGPNKPMIFTVNYSQ